MGVGVAPKLPRLSTKPLPATVGAWRIEVMGIARFMLACVDPEQPDVFEWREKMAVHYTFRLADLLNNKPKRPRGRPRRVR